MVPAASQGDSAGSCTTDPGVETLPYRDIYAPQRLGNITVISIRKAISQPKSFSLQPLAWLQLLRQHSHPLREGCSGTGKAGEHWGLGNHQDESQKGNLVRRCEYERWMNRQRGEGDAETGATGWEKGAHAPRQAPAPHLSLPLQRGPAGLAVPSLTH